MLNKTQEEITAKWKSLDTEHPLVSIKCLAYNHEKYIGQTLDSFLMQETDFPFEVIVHDDASTDKTADIRTIIPKGYDTAIESDTEDLSGAITRMSLCGGVEEGFSEVAVKVGMDEIVISAKDPNLGWGTESVSCKTEGEEVTLSLNAGYLTDMMNAVPYTRFRAEMSGPNRAVVFTPVGAEGYKYVLVPLQQRAGAVA